MTGFDCAECTVKTYDSTKSTTMKSPSNTDTSLDYLRTQYGEDTTSTFGGYYVKDRMCFNGVVDRLNCTSRSDNGFEFFVVNSLNNDIYYSNALFSGILGLSVNSSNSAQSIVEYLTATDQIDKNIVSIYSNTTYGLVKLGQFDEKYILQKTGSPKRTEPVWTGL